MPVKHIRCLVFLIVVPLVWCAPLNHDIDWSPLTALSDLNSAVSGMNARVASRAGLLQGERDPRLPLSLPSPQDLETIKKVAQILVLLGEQILPSISGEPPSKPSTPAYGPPPQDIPNDPVK